ncbi:MAG TPA: VOC family protein [Gemmatimonadales bacterium]|jgi:predicted enzyme related to lactoylglutathione lyase
MDHTVVHFEIPADQPERAAKFYQELFGWDINKYEGDVGMEYWMVQTVPTGEDGRPTRPGVNGGLMRRMFPGQAPVNYIAVESVDEFVRKAERLGAKLLVGKQPVPSMGWFAQFTDPEGNVFAVWETDPNAGPAAVGAEEQAGQRKR